MEEGKGIRIAYIFRHGARAPSHSALKAFKNTEISSCWEPEEIENLTEVGKHCSFLIGKSFASHDDYKNVKPVNSTKWLSSPSIRAEESGRMFVKGFENGLRNNNDPEIQRLQSQLAEAERIIGQDLNSIFRPWTVNQDYLNQNREVKEGDVFREKANIEINFLSELYESISPNFEFSPAKMLSLTTYLVEIIECERYDPKNRTSLLRKLTENQIFRIFELGRWCWNERFFRLPCSPNLGKPLLDTIFENSNEHDLVYYAGHDYTILALLAALGIKEYPQEVLGYSSYLKLHIDPSERDVNLKIKSITLNPRPFEHHSTEYEVAAHNEVSIIDLISN